MQLKITNGIEVGVDEVGRGCLAGPVVAAAVILPNDFWDGELNDSKQLSHKKRDRLRTLIEKEALAYAVGEIDHKAIDEVNIQNATYMAMHQALEKITHPYDRIAVDGNRFKPFNEIPYQCVVKGDALYMHIAAASILAKTHRDRLMLDWHQQYPHYGWDSNKGYPTAFHKKALAVYGPTPIHRLSFKW